MQRTALLVLAASALACDHAEPAAVTRPHLEPRANLAAPVAAASTLVFYSGRSGNFEIWSVAPDGSRLRQITDHPAQDVIPSLSPNGRRIAFQSNRAGNFDIWVMDADGSNALALTTDPAFETSPAWSPDGKQIAFVRSTTDGVMSTRNGALAMGRAKDFGTLEAGKLADLLVLAEDPSVNVRAFRSLTHVMRGGRLHRQTTLAQRRPGTP